MKVRELCVAVFFAFGIFWAFFRSKLLSEDEGPDEDEGSQVVCCRIFAFGFLDFGPVDQQM